MNKEPIQFLPVKPFWKQIKPMPISNALAIGFAIGVAATLTAIAICCGN
jgi:hypothetical protein